MDSRPPELILASTSRYRRSLLERLQLPFRCEAPEVDEQARPGEAPQALAQRLAAEKARAVSRRHPAALVLGSDQVASLDGQALGKPGNPGNACAQLRASSGRALRFHTAVSIARGGVELDRCCVDTLVQFRDLSAEQIEDYVDREQPLDCAGSFRWEALGIALFRSLESTDPTALEGLPLIETVSMLERNGFTVLKAAT